MNPGERETAAAATIRECRAALAASGGSIVGEAIGETVSELADWRHYPDGEVYDPVTHVQYFFHSHPAGALRRGHETAEEGGHFHLFLRGDGMPAGMSPMLFADSAVGQEPRRRPSAPLRRGRRDEVCHVVAIVIGRGGEPTGLFTTNRWVTGETWYRAGDMIRLVDRVRFDRARPASLLDRWIEAVVSLFQPEIGALLEERDRAIVRWRWRWPRGNALEDERLEVTSSRAIDLDARLAAVEGHRLAPVGMAMRHSPAMPLASDGWGR